MSPNLITMIFLPCASVTYDAALTNETVVYSCPETAIFVYDKPVQDRVLLDPMSYARNRHLVEGPREDRMPAVAKPVAVKKAASKPKRKKYRKKRRRA